MYAVASIALLGIFSAIVTHRSQREQQPLSRKVSKRLQKLWDDAQIGIREKKYLRAEKALLTILRFDQKNAPAYNRLGILYAKQKEYQDAIHCFEVASSIEPSASSYHNLGLIYYETEENDKAALAFEHAIDMEDSYAARYVAYAKVQERLGAQEKVVLALEHALVLEKNPQTFSLLAEAYVKNGQQDKAKEIKQKAKRIIMPAGRPKKIRQPRKIVM
jgi:superkiller protein 3